MLLDIQPGNTKILYFFNCLLDGMHTISFSEGVYLACGKSTFTVLWRETPVFWPLSDDQRYPPVFPVQGFFPHP